jgi:hypothetical protein
MKLSAVGSAPVLWWRVPVQLDPTEGGDLIVTARSTGPACTGTLSPEGGTRSSARNVAFLFVRTPDSGQSPKKPLILSVNTPSLELIKIGLNLVRWIRYLCLPVGFNSTSYRTQIELHQISERAGSSYIRKYVHDVTRASLLWTAAFSFRYF